MSKKQKRFKKVLKKLDDSYINPEFCQKVGGHPINTTLVAAILLGLYRHGGIKLTDEQYYKLRRILKLYAEAYDLGIDDDPQGMYDDNTGDYFARLYLNYQPAFNALFEDSESDDE